MAKYHVSLAVRTTDKFDAVVEAENDKEAFDNAVAAFCSSDWDRVDGQITMTGAPWVLDSDEYEDPVKSALIEKLDA